MNNMRYLFALVFLVLSISFSTAYAQWATLPNGVYMIASDCNHNYVMDYDAGQTANGTNIHCWEYNGSAAQQWYICGENICPVCNITAVVDNYNENQYCGNNVHIWQANGSVAQKWLFKHHGGDLYSIHLKANTNYVIDLSASNTYNGNNIQLWEYNGSKAQLWHIKSLGSNSSGSSGATYVAPYTPTSTRCGVCNGSGSCSICGGSGRSPNHASGIVANCGGCGGTGHCATCGGRGNY